MAKRTLDQMLDGPEGPAPEVEETSASPRTVFDTAKKFGANETTTPRLVIAQGLSQEVRDRHADVGDFLVTGFPPEKSVTLVITGHAVNRRYLKQGEQKAACWSPDGVQGFGDPGIKCELCPLKDWGRDEEAGRPIQPPCSEIDVWAAFSVTHGMAVQWPLKGTAAKASRFIKTICNGMGMGNFAIEVTTKNMSKNGRSWSEPAIVVSQELTPDECRQYASVAAGAFVTREAPVIPLTPVGAGSEAEAPAEPTVDHSDAKASDF